VAQARLNTLLNLPPKHPLPKPARAAGGPRELPPLSSLEAAALEKRPELLALTHRVDARSADVELAHREYFPDFAVNAAYDSLWEDPDKQTLVGFAIDVPLQLGRRRAEVSAAEAAARHARAELEHARADTLLEVSEAYDKLVETAHVVHLYESSILPLARESLEAARSGYESGTNDFQTLVETEKTLYLSELTYQEALAAYHQGRARLEYAVGRPLDALDRTEVRP
jgi:outer membrane protein TolC